MVSHVFMADVGHSGQIMSYASYADSAWSCVGNGMPSNFKWVRDRRRLIGRCVGMKVVSGPVRVSWTGDAG